MKHKTRYITTLACKAFHVNLDIYPNAGPNPSITGMKKLYWGEDCYTVKHGNYVYKVPRHIWEIAKP